MDSHEVPAYFVASEESQESADQGLSGMVLGDSTNGLITLLSAEKTFQQEVHHTSASQKTALNLPIDGTGIWLLKAKVGSATSETIIVRSNLAAIIHRGVGNTRKKSGPNQARTAGEADEEKLRWLFQLGVDGILINDVKLAASVLAQLG